MQWLRRWRAGLLAAAFSIWLPAVEENRTSASSFASRSRLNSDLPDGFVEDAPPDWHVVPSNGDCIRHDQRRDGFGTAQLATDAPDGGTYSASDVMNSTTAAISSSDSEFDGIAP